jgi:tryptophanyl-tRNA synthetase
MKKIKSTVTDTGREVIFDETKKPGISNLLTIYAALTSKSISEAEAEFDGKGYGDFKGAVATVVADYFGPIRVKTNELIANPSGLREIIEFGAKKAEEIADQTLRKVYKKLGLLPRSLDEI